MHPQARDNTGGQCPQVVRSAVSRLGTISKVMNFEAPGPRWCSLAFARFLPGGSRRPFAEASMTVLPPVRGHVAAVPAAQPGAIFSLGQLPAF
jgi:hypothetical protein